MAALTFAGLFTLGGTAPLDPGSLVAAMVGVHTLIGVGEGVLTALVVGSVVAVRPDLVHGARRIRAASIQAAAPAPSSGHRA
jgi:cobalt/nickel transport system permease protein